MNRPLSLTGVTDSGIGGILLRWINALTGVTDSGFLCQNRLRGFMTLRKVNLSTSALTDNAVSFVNQTARTLHIRKSKIVGSGSGTAAVLGDMQTASLDEVPISQAKVNDSRSHIQSANAQVIGGTGAIAATHENSYEVWGRDDLKLEPDEALFLNITDDVGALDMTWTATLHYET